MCVRLLLSNLYDNGFVMGICQLERLYSTLIPLMSQHGCKKYFFPQKLEGLYSTLITVSFVSLGDYVPPQVLL